MIILYNYPNEDTVGTKENNRQILSREAKGDFSEKVASELKTGRRAFQERRMVTSPWRPGGSRDQQEAQMSPAQNQMERGLS